MIIFNNKNTKKGIGDGLVSYMLIGQNNCSIKNISIQYSEIIKGKEQPLHRHLPEQCYYIIDGEGLILIDREKKTVKIGDAIYIPSNAEHGIINTGKVLLKYLTANTPAFGIDYENKLWSK
jgi:mannose-6-phosphate isomerase-like protein (cupin superfamily)